MKVALIGRPSHEFINHSLYLLREGMLFRSISFKYPFANSLKDIIDIFLEKNKSLISKELKKKFTPVLSYYLVRKLTYLFSPFSNPLDKKQYSDTLADNFFSFLASFNLKYKADIYHAWAPYAFHTFKKAKRKENSYVNILELYAAEPNYANEIYSTYFSVEQMSIMQNKNKSVNLRKTIEYTDAIIVPSSYVKNSIADYFDPERIYIIPFGADTKNFYPINKERNFYSRILTVLYVGTVCYEKGFDILHATIMRMRARGIKIRFVVAGKVGSGYKKEFYKKMSTFEYLEYVPRSELNKIYNLAHILVLPSYSEGSPLVVYESLASGLPVIVSKNAESIVTNGSDGLIVEVNSIEDLEAKLEFVHNNRNWLESASIKARLKALAFTWENRSKKIIELYASLVEKRF